MKKTWFEEKTSESVFATGKSDKSVGLRGFSEWIKKKKSVRKKNINREYEKRQGGNTTANERNDADAAAAVQCWRGA